ncbi:MAG: SUMF1/EgtB/PvdO family nonheme iron enzyme [Nitrospirota bacterium]|nr:SUMF1/EgtB/PvdO family nonheme iron enzyme [Nitrospirota bacterium]MDH5586493.1 SUMF1/EgtB/PvdO family nonheme iron enzyme [Nitrospirota bacterium]
MTSLKPQNFLLAPLAFVAIAVWGSVSSFAHDIEELKHGVVKITANNPNRLGTGVIVGIEGNTAYIATASHVIEGDASPQIIFYQNNQVYSATTKGMEGANPKGLAALVVEGDLPSGIRPIGFNIGAQFNGGEKVTIIGFPKMVPVPWAVTEGTITGLVGPDLIFTGTVEEGNSGGPLLYKGKVVGLITEIAKPFNFAKPGVIAQYELKNWDIKISDILVEKLPEKDQHVVQPKNPKILKPPGPLSNSFLSPTKIGKDGAPMVLVPDGEFLKGSRSFKDNPPRKTLVKAFYIDTYEVTVERYAKFLKQGSDTQRIPAGWDDVNLGAHRKHPVAGTNYFDAYSYCRWVGKRLPTNDEWEKAARGTDGRKYPWGNEKPHESMTNFNKNYCFFCNVYDEKISPIGSFQKDKSPFGVFDMAGNVTEWVDEGNRRGGDWRTGWPGADESMELARLWPSDKMTKNPGGNPDQGFRCAQDAP